MIYTVTLNITLDLVYETSRIQKDQINQTQCKAFSVGGKGINISRALQCLGLESRALGFCGGQVKDFISRKLQSEGIQSCLTNIEKNSRINVKIIEKKERNVVEFNEFGPTVRASEVNRLLDNIARKCQKGDYFVLAGSLPRNIGTDIYGRIITMVHQKGAKVLLDASGEPLRLGIAAKPDFLKINREELLSISKDGNTQSMVEQYIQAGIKKVMITSGSQEVVYRDPVNLLSAKPPHIQGLAAVGSGDSVDAGMLYSIMGQFGATELLKTSIACGSANLLTPIPGKIDPQEVKRLTTRITVEQP